MIHFGAIERLRRYVLQLGVLLDRQLLQVEALEGEIVDDANAVLVEQEFVQCEQTHEGVRLDASESVLLQVEGPDIVQALEGVRLDRLDAALGERQRLQELETTEHADPQHPYMVTLQQRPG